VAYADVEVTMQPTYTLLVTAKTVTFLLGGGLALLAFRVARDRDSRQLHALGTGFLLVTLGSVTSALHHVAPLSQSISLRVGSVLTAVGFAAFGYSLYATGSVVPRESSRGIQ
jgi:hypothetical protein